MDTPKRPTLDYNALCVDTCIYDSQGMAFDRGLLKQLEQFSSSPVTFIVPEVVHFELEKHLTERLRDAHTKVARALRIATDELGVQKTTAEEVERLILSGYHENLGAQRLKDFYARTQAEVLSSSRAPMGRLVEMYFETQAPFEAAGKKKSEFPDAIALLSLEEWAATNDCYVLVVSTDGGWREFCEGSRHLKLLDDLGDALAHFQPHNIAATLVLELQSQIDRGESSEILDSIRAELAEFVERQLVEAEASSSTFDLEERYVEATYLSHDFRTHPDDAAEINLVHVWSDGLVLQLRATVSCEVTGEYGLSIRDPIDRDHVSLGNAKVSTTTKFDADVVVTLVGDFSRGSSGVQVENVDVEGTLELIEFGELDPDPGEDEWIREKYV